MKRQFCRRYGIDPRTTISRRDVIEDAAFAQYETNGETPADRVEAVLSAIFYVVKTIAATQGISPDSIDRVANNVALTRPQKWVEPTQEELEEREAAEIRRDFAPSLKRMLAFQNKQKIANEGASANA